MTTETQQPNKTTAGQGEASDVERSVMPDFEREFRYYILKFKDINKYLTIDDKEKLLAIARKIDRGRCDDNKMPLNCVVVEHDWPEYEPTWGAIEARMKA